VGRSLGSLAALVALVGCAGTGLRTTRETRYLGVFLDARKLGASELERAAEDDPAVRAYLEANGDPDFILIPRPPDVELIYYLRSVLVQFHRASPDAASVMGTLTPLPNGVLNMLPSDLRAGTPGPTLEVGTGVNCWNVTVGTAACRTCCAGPTACVVHCDELR
jgi:hypothetical protein